MAFDRTPVPVCCVCQDRPYVPHRECTGNCNMTMVLDPTAGEVANLPGCHLDDTDRRLPACSAIRWRITWPPAHQEEGREALERIVREQAFTVLHRLALCV